jgi:hypothetical protein
MSSDEMKEVNSKLDRMLEEQLLSSFDSVLLLLLPLTTFLLSATLVLWNPERFVALMTELLAILFAIVLIVLVYGKLSGSSMLRVFAWFLFFFLLSVAVVAFACNEILSIFTGSPFKVSTAYLLYYLLGEALVGIGISLTPIRWMKGKMHERLPITSNEVERAYHQLWKDRPTSLPSLEAFIIIAGLSALLFSARMGVSGIPPFMFATLDVIMYICLAFCLLSIGWGLIMGRKNRAPKR